MASKAELLALALRVEQATGPDRYIDAQIAAACRVGAEEWPWVDNYPSWEGRADGRVCLEAGGPSFASSNFTASLDAAISLVPDQHRSGVLHHVLADIQRTGFPHMTFLQRLILGVVSEALRALASEQPA